MPIRTVTAPLPAIESLDRLHRGESRRPIPGFDDEGEDTFDIADVVRQVEEAANTTISPWPAPQRGSGRGATPDDPWRELSARRLEIAKLHKVQQKHLAALKQARNLIESLDKSVNLSRASLTQQEKEAAVAKRALQRSEEEKKVLRAELEQTKADFAALQQRTDDLNAAFGQREQDIATVRKTIVTLKAALSAKAAGEADLTAAIEDAKARYYNDFNKRCAQFEEQIEKLAQMVGVRDERIKMLEDDNTKLAARCGALLADVRALEAAKQDAQKQLESQAATVTFLDATLRGEREAADQKIAKLVMSLQCERLERAADARDSAAACREIALLLPKLARQLGRSIEPGEWFAAPLALPRPTG